MNRMRRPRRSTSRMGFLEGVAGIALLDRMPMPILAVGLDDGALVYTNPASADLLGYDDSTALTAQTLPELMADREHTSPRDCVTALTAAEGAVTDLKHADGYLIRTIVSNSLLARPHGPVMLVGLTDTTELSWTSRQ